MDQEVHTNVPTTRRDVFRVRVPSEEEDSNVMIPVKEDQILFPEDDEDSISQFGNLRKNKEPSPVTGDSRVFNITWTTDRMLKPKGLEDMEHLRHRPEGSNDREDG
jgi:hypothetical protein